MKRILLVMAICMAAATGVSAKGGLTVAKRAGNQDTIVVKMANGAKMILQLKNMKQLEAFQNYSLDSLMRELNNYVKQVDKMEGATEKDGNPKQMTVTFNTKEGDTDEAEEVNVTIQETDAKGKVTKEHHQIKVGRNIKIDVEIEEDGDTTKVNIGDQDGDSDDDNHIEIYKATRFNFDIDLGLNTFIDKENASFVPDLKPMGSRYVSLNSHMISQIGGQKSPFYLVSGVEFAFNNYMFDKNVIIQDNDDVTEFTKVADINYEKSKLATSSINIPLMPMLKFKRANGKDGFHIGAGGFAGYRLGSHSKVKYEQEGNSTKDKDHGSFNLSDFQYGATGVIGYNNFSLFVKYNMNDLFKEERGPQVNVISFGFRLLN
ncbi:PorT family protein [Pontibacter sp. BT310]|uniref:PorT family protein n=1 Tax=Pontibacter populi TaxID=890055 RepID=A0ABS6XFW2_9BACT|nr:MULTISPECIES: outer membrane beta-barrel protein [Pontibacter]MBJ6120036.1 PorT family protein [Pontibacter sp. BT310]MBR0572465.1 PorT family protein [Microvirga sp. STS03]MBW3366889.1 PorT family protein [Pontibacter populi]